MLVGSRAFKNSADVWQQALAGFNGLARLFSETELFLGRFPVLKIYKGPTWS
jgi:hypothetical protein